MYSEESHAFIWNGTAYQKLTCNNILWIEAQEKKVRVVAQKQQYWLTTTLDHLHQLLPCSSLKRVHPSFIVNLNRIEGFDHFNILIRQKSIPIGTDFMDFFKAHFKVSPNLLILAKKPQEEPKSIPPTTS